MSFLKYNFKFLSFAYKTPFCLRTLQEVGGYPKMFDEQR